MSDQIYRCIITVVDERCSVPAVSNIFMRAMSAELANQFATKTYRDMLANNGYPNDLKLRTEVFISSEDEALHYKQGMQSGQVSRNVN